MTNLENALVWLYVKTWGKFGDYVISQNDLWNFGAQDLETAIMGLAYPGKSRETGKSERVKALADLITEKFENNLAFYEWSLKIHHENVENFSETVQSQRQGPIKIRKIQRWEPGKY